MSAIKKFKVNDGKHVDENGKVFTKGQVVTSAKNLTKLFPLKFTQVSADDSDAEVEDADEETEETAKPAVKGAKKGKKKVVFEDEEKSEDEA